MAITKSPGLVLQRIAFGDTSLILKVYTADHGLITLIAKGAKTPKSKFRALVDFFLVLQWVYPSGGRGEIWTLHDASLMEDLPHIRRQPVKQALGQVWLEAYLRLSPGAGEAAQRFDWLAQHLQSLDAAEGQADLNRLSIDFMVGFCHLSGYAPQFRVCIHCGESVEDPRLRMHMELGGPVCRACRKPGEATVALSREAARLIERCEESGWLCAAPSQIHVQAAETFLWSFLHRHAGEGHRLKALDIYREMTSEG